MRKWKKLASRLIEMENRLAQKIIELKNMETASYSVHAMNLDKIRDMLSKKELVAIQRAKRENEKVDPTAVRLKPSRIVESAFPSRLRDWTDLLDRVETLCNRLSIDLREVKVGPSNAPPVDSSFHPDAKEPEQENE